VKMSSQAAFVLCGFLLLAEFSFPTVYAQGGTQQPTIKVLSPLNDSFYNVSLGGVSYQLTYETDSALSWVGYSLDGTANVTVTGNGTLVHNFVSSNGYHTLTVFANDTSGNWAFPQTVTYLVNFYPDYRPSSSQSSTVSPSPSPSVAEFPNWIILPLIAAAATMIVYFERRSLKGSSCHLFAKLIQIKQHSTFKNSVNYCNYSIMNQILRKQHLVG
jgi:hypothetical protein